MLREAVLGTPFGEIKRYGFFECPEDIAWGVSKIVMHNHPSLVKDARAARQAISNSPSPADDVAVRLVARKASGPPDQQEETTTTSKRKFNMLPTSKKAQKVASMDSPSPRSIELQTQANKDRVQVVITERPIGKLEYISGIHITGDESDEEWAQGHWHEDDFDADQVYTDEEEFGERGATEEDRCREVANGDGKDPRTQNAGEKDAGGYDASRYDSGGRDAGICDASSRAANKKNTGKRSICKSIFDDKTLDELSDEFGNEDKSRTFGEAIAAFKQRCDIEEAEKVQKAAAATAQTSSTQKVRTVIDLTLNDDVSDLASPIASARLTTIAQPAAVAPPLDNSFILAYAQTYQAINGDQARKHGPKSAW